MDRFEIFYKIVSLLGWVWFFIKKPFKWFGKLSWRAKLLIIILILVIFDSLRFWIFNILVWLLQ